MYFSTRHSRCHSFSLNAYNYNYTLAPFLFSHWIISLQRPKQYSESLSKLARWLGRVFHSFLKRIFAGFELGKCLVGILFAFLGSKVIFFENYVWKGMFIMLFFLSDYSYLLLRRKTMIYQTILWWRRARNSFQSHVSCNDALWNSAFPICAFLNSWVKYSPRGK